MISLFFLRVCDEMTNRLYEVLHHIRQANFKLKPSKCHFYQTEVAYLGHILSAEGIRPNPENTNKVLNWKTPQTVKETKLSWFSQLL